LTLLRLEKIKFIDIVLEYAEELAIEDQGQLDNFAVVLWFDLRGGRARGAG
jgi:hypothetical protein